jgi:choline dehydrogenase-like flavoprotein
LTWGGGSFRFSDFEFKPSQRGITGCDWPVRYDDLAAHYARCEHILGVQGARDGLPEVPDGDTSPCVDFPLATEFAQTVERARQGVRVVNLRLTRRSSTFEGAGVSSWETSLPVAAATGRLTLRTEAYARRILVDPVTDLARGVEFVDQTDGTEHAVEAKIVILCASTIATARILLNSATPVHPAGLANSSGLVGRYLMDHVYVAAFRAVSESSPCDFGPRNALTLYVPWPYSARISPNTDRGRFAITGSIALVDQIPTLGLAAFGEVAPRPENRVTLDDKLTDRWGVPAAHIEYSYSEAEREMVGMIGGVFRDLAEAGGFRQTQAPMFVPPGLSIHEVGTARMGDDPRTSVLNSYNQCWDVENLFVMDGAAFVTSTFIHPTLTMMALASRACDYIAEKLRRYAI